MNMQILCTTSLTGCKYEKKRWNRILIKSHHTFFNHLFKLNIEVQCVSIFKNKLRHIQYCFTSRTVRNTMEYKYATIIRLHDTKFSMRTHFHSLSSGSLYKQTIYVLIKLKRMSD